MITCTWLFFIIMQTCFIRTDQQEDPPSLLAQEKCKVVIQGIVDQYPDESIVTKETIVEYLNIEVGDSNVFVSFESLPAHVQVNVMNALIGC